MKLTRFSALCLLTAGLFGAPSILLAGSAPAVRLHVSPHGDDARDGSAPDRAFATLARARDAVRALKERGALPPGGVAIEIAPGVYPLDQTLSLSATDSGSPGAPIIYRAAGGEVRLRGGRALALKQFTPVREAALRARLDPAARDHVVSLDLRAAGVRHVDSYPAVFSDSGGLFELFWNGARLPLSRWPNTGAATMQRVLVTGDHKTPGAFVAADERLARWTHNPHVWLKGQWRVGWEDPAIRVARLDPETRTVTFAAGIPNGIGYKYLVNPDGSRPGNGKEPWWALNLLEEIDRPGEWALDFATGRLYLWPPAADGELIVSQLATPMISLRGAAHLDFIGLTLECSLGDGIVVERGDQVRIAGCTLRNLAGDGIRLHALRSTVQSCDLYDLGKGAIEVTGGDAATLTASGNAVLNNHVRRYGALKAMYSAGINIGGFKGNNTTPRSTVGVRVAHNLIHDAPRDAILVSGQDHVFECNEIYRCGFASADVGAFYSWLDWTIRGVVIRHNYIHDTVGGVNPDDGATGFTVYGNVFVGPRTGVWIASGADHQVVNNIFVKDEGPVYGIDDRGASRGYATNRRLLETARAMNPDQPPWSERFPQLAQQLRESPELPLRNRFERNLIVMRSGEPVALKVGAAVRADPRFLSEADNLVVAEDPGFIDAAAGNYGLRADSPVFTRLPAFEPIPFERIGLQVDEYRRQLPPDAETRRPKPNAPDAAGEKHFGT